MNLHAVTGQANAMTLGDRAAEALRDYREGRTAALEAFVHDATPLLWNVVRAQGVARDDAEDVVQGVWVAFVRHTGSIREPEAALAWLLVSARRAAWLAVRRQRGDAARHQTSRTTWTRSASCPPPSRARRPRYSRPTGTGCCGGSS